MLARETTFSFRSPLAPWMEKFIREKRALGCRYDTEFHVLCRLDRYLCGVGLDAEHLPREVILQWTAAAPHERPSTPPHAPGRRWRRR